MTKTLRQWARILRESDEKTLEVLIYIKEEKIGDITFFDHDCEKIASVTKALRSNAALHKNISKVTVMSRRMRKEEIERDNNVLRQRRFRAKQKSNAESNKKITSHSSFSSSSSRKDPAKTPDLNYQKIFKKNLESVKSKIDKISRLIKTTGKQFNSWAWVYLQVDSGMHPDAILESLDGLIKYWKRIDGDPWSYANKIIETKDKNFKEGDHIKESQKFKNLWDVDPEIKNLAKELFA
jgi:hypothetical protein